MKKILCILLLVSACAKAISQPAVTPMVGKAFADKNGASAIRMGVGFNQVFKDRWGFYYTYEYRSSVMFFENTAYSKNEYRRDLMGINCKVHPNFTVYGGVGMFMDGVLQGQFQSKGGGLPYIIKPLGLRKELGITYQPSDIPLQISAGYSLSIGFTGNIGWRIPLEPNRMTVHQALTEE
ncbi:MAG: hypothetical protein EBT60_08700 [Bacteroidetes bacterium]|jgi:hypothetical protein|nr:hypothetical protein [Bacteroidota bacterium]